MSKRSSQSLAFWWWMIKLGAELKLSWLILCTLNTEIKIAATDTIAPDFFMGCWEVWLIGNYRYFTIAQSHSPETVGIPHWNTWKISGNLQHSQLTHVNPQSPFRSDRVTPKPLHMRAPEDLPAWDCLRLPEPGVHLPGFFPCPVQGLSYNFFLQSALSDICGPESEAGGETGTQIMAMAQFSAYLRM